MVWHDAPSVRPVWLKLAGFQQLVLVQWGDCPATWLAAFSLVGGRAPAVREGWRACATAVVLGRSRADSATRCAYSGMVA